MIPKGYYEAVAIEGQLCEAGTGKPQVAVLFEITEEGEFKGQRRTWYGFFGDEAVFKDGRTLTQVTLESLRNAGWSNDDISDIQGLGETNVSLVIDHEPDQNGVVRERVRWVNRPGRGGLKVRNAMSDVAKKSFAAQLKAQAIVSRQKSPAVPRTPTGPRNSAPLAKKPDDGFFPPASDDDIPF
jgi:hypothetical protein